VPGWGKLVAGAVIGAAGALYATNEELRKVLPERARDLPVAARRRFRLSVAAAREASALRRAEILRDLEAHGGDHTERRALEARGEGVPPEVLPVSTPSPRAAEEPVVRTEDV
jgi:hypothetical protein